MTARMIALVLLAACSSARAELEFCNRTNQPVSIAVMSVTNGVWYSKGWYNAAPGACVNTIAGPLNARYYYFYADRSDGTKWAGDGKVGAVGGCVIHNARFTIDERKPCAEVGAETVNYVRIDTADATRWTQDLTHASETVSFSAPQNVERACQVLYSRLNRPSLRTQKVVIGRYTDILTLPQTKTECTNVYDTGVPDISTCRTAYDGCASKWHGPFGSWGCIPGTTTRCTNIKTCNTWASYKKTMECDLTLQLKLPSFVEQPLERFVDNGFRVMGEFQTTMPTACVSAEVRNAARGASSDAIAQAITMEIERRVRSVVEREARRWFEETAIQAIVASIPTGGVGGAAAMGTSLATLIHRTHRAVEPIVKIAREARDLAEDMGFNTSCGWSDWTRF